MSSEAERLQEINKKQREKILLLKTRAQKGYNRPSPMVSNNASPNISYTYSNSIKNSSKPMTLELLKQYESNKTSSQGDYSLDRGADKSVDYNSTLFKYFKEQSNLTDKDPMNNGSSISMQSGGAAQADQSQQLYKDDSLLNKIDELLKKNKNKPKTGINQKKTLSNSSGLSNHSNTNFSNQFSSTAPKLKSNTTSTYLQKLKTIQEQKATLTIQRQQFQDKKRTKKNQSPAKQVESNRKKPPLAPTLNSVSAIQRQKKKIQDTIQQIKKQQSYQFHDKDSLILELSDNESQLQQKQKYSIQTKENRTKIQNEQSKQIQRQKLKQQRNILLKQMQKIQRQLEQLQKQEQQQQI